MRRKTLTIKRAAFPATLTAIFLLANAGALAQGAKEKASLMIKEVVSSSFPELAEEDIRVKEFSSSSDFFRSKFSVSRLLSFRPRRLYIEVNPEVYNRNAPEIGIRAIIAHELAHALYYKRHYGPGLFGLAGLADESFAAKFERKADLQAISKGYGKGLIEYRRWLYANIPAKALKSKLKNYFSPEEIERILMVIGADQTAIERFYKKPPRNLGEIR